MSFKAMLEVDGELFKVIKTSYTINRKVDELGRLTSSIVGGQINLEIESSENNLFFEHICNSMRLNNGSIVFNKRHEDSTMRKLEFKDAYVTSITETFDHSGLIGTMKMEIILIAKEIEMGGEPLGNEHFHYAVNR